MWGIVVPAFLVGGLSLVAARKVKARKNALTEKRKETFERAMVSSNDDMPSDRLYRLADEFQRVGLKEQTNLLRKRAALRDMSPEEKKRNSEILQRAFTSKNLEAIEKVAKAFEEKGAVGAAASLRKYSSGISNLRAEPKECVVEIADNHGHKLDLIPEDLLRKRDWSIKGEADHDHIVRLGPAALEHNIVVESSETNGHTHRVSVQCKQPQAATSSPEDSVS